MSAAATRYDIRLVISYDYGSSVPFARHVLRIQPEHDERQQVENASLLIEPAPSEQLPGFDFFGNRTMMLALDHHHDRLEVRYQARVVPDRADLPASSPGWEQVRDAMSQTRDLSARAPVHFLFPDRATLADSELLDFALPSFPAGRPIVEAASDFCQRIHRDFEYAPGTTTVHTTALEILHGRQGVCQDFAHLMIAGMRALGLPIAYVSGLLRTVPPPGKPRLEGADAMHAWVSIWAGDAIGWVGFDPTNAVPASSDHIRVAMGREYADVAPIDGVIIAAGEHENSVAVDVVEVPGT